MSSVNLGWIGFIAVLIIILLGYLAIWSVVLKGVKRVARVIAILVGFAGLAIYLFLASEFFSYFYLCRMSSEVHNQAKNRQQVRTILKHFYESQVPVNTTCFTNCGIKNAKGVTSYRYSFFRILSADNCIEIGYDRNNRVVYVLDVFE